MVPLPGNLMCWLFIIHFCHCICHCIICSLPIIGIIPHLSNQQSCQPLDTPTIDKTSAVTLINPRLIKAISVFLSIIKYTKNKELSLWRCPVYTSTLNQSKIKKPGQGDLSRNYYIINKENVTLKKEKKWFFFVWWRGMGYTYISWF